MVRFMFGGSKWLVLLVAVVGLAGCGAKERVTLSATVRNVDLRVEQRLLGTFLAGGFDLRLALGANAPESTTASLEAFRLVRASDQTELVSSLPLADVPAHIDIAPGREQTISLELDDTDPISPDSQARICAEPVKILGAVTDTLSDERTTPAESPSVVPGGC
jgi:hypothetical protein